MIYCWSDRLIPCQIIDFDEGIITVKVTTPITTEKFKRVKGYDTKIKKVNRSQVVGWCRDGDRGLILTTGGGWQWFTVRGIANDGLRIELDKGGGEFSIPRMSKGIKLALREIEFEQALELAFAQQSLLEEANEEAKIV